LCVVRFGHYDGGEDGERAGEDDYWRTVRRGEGHVGVYSPAARRRRIELFLASRRRRVWGKPWAKKTKYGARKSASECRLRAKGRFVKKEDEELLRDLVRLF